MAYSLVSGRLRESVITAPVLFAVAGLLLGPRVLEWADLQAASKPIELLAEATLALILFNDAAAIDWPSLRHNRDTPLRLLVIALPLTMIAGALEYVFKEAAAIALGPRLRGQDAPAPHRG